MVFGFRKFDLYQLLQEDLGILLAIPDLQTFLHSELYEMVEEKSRDILEESGDLTWNIHGNETFKRYIANNTPIATFVT